MLKKLIFFLSLACGTSLAQEKSSAVIVVGRVLNGEDSLMLREKFFNGLKSRTAGSIAESESYFREVLGIDPSNDAAAYELARIYHAQNDEDTAEKYARDAVTVNSSNKWYWLLLADIYKKSANYEQLNLVFTDLIRLEPQNEDYYFDKANALYLSKKLAEAEQVYNDIEKRFGSSDQLINSRQRIYQQQGSPARAASELEKLISAHPREASYYLGLSDLYIKAGDSSKALKVLLEARDKVPSNPFVHLALADIYSGQGKKQDASEELKAAFNDPELKIDAKVGIILSFYPEFKDPAVRAQTTQLAKVLTEMYPAEAKAFSVYGDVLYQDQKLNEARAAYKKALELNAQIYLIWEQVLRIDMGKNDYALAIADGEEALSIFPNQAALYFYTALAYAQEEKHEKAVEYLTNAANLEVENKSFQSQIYASLGDSYNALKKYKESDAAYTKALDFDGENTYVMNNYAYYLSLRGENLTKAANISYRSNELQPGNASFQDTYAWVLFKQKKYAEARIWIEKAIKNNPGSGVLAEHYGDILYHLKEPEAALEQWKSAKEKGVRSRILERKINEKKFFE